MGMTLRRCIGAAWPMPRRESPTPSITSIITSTVRATTARAAAAAWPAATRTCIGSGGFGCWRRRELCWSASRFSSRYAGARRPRQPRPPRRRSRSRWPHACRRAHRSFQRLPQTHRDAGGAPGWRRRAGCQHRRHSAARPQAAQSQSCRDRGVQSGERVRILEGPVDADGFTWWKIEGASGTGWSAQQSKEGVVWLQPIKEQ